MDRREQTDWTETADDRTDESAGAKSDETGPDPATAGGEGTVAQRLKRVTRYASEAAKTGPAEPAAARREPEPSIDELLQPTPPAAPPEEAAQHHPAPAADAQPQPASSVESRPEPAPASDIAQSTAAREAPRPDVPEFEAPVEGTAAIADVEPEPEPDPGPVPVPDETAVAAPATGEHAIELAPAVPEAPTEPAAIQAQPEGPPAGQPADQHKEADASAESPESTAADGEILTVGRGIRLVAKLCECAELLVEGHLEATARAGHLMVGRGGHFIGSAEVDTAEIHGHFEGNLTVAKRLHISATGSVAGTTCYQEIVIDAGGQVMGNAQRLSENAEAGNTAA